LLGFALLLVVHQLTMSGLMWAAWYGLSLVFVSLSDVVSTLLPPRA
jgi:hypothetical protein